MSIPKRIANISKAYLHQVRDRIDAELTDAERELQSSVDGHSVDQSVDAGDPDALFRRAEARIAASRRESEARAEQRPATTPVVSPTSTDPNASDYRVLGVPVGADLAQVQSAYEQLTRRCDPRRFPEGSAEQTQAAAILVRVNAAFDALRKRLDPTENRFGKLELE